MKAIIPRDRRMAVLWLCAYASRYSKNKDSEHQALQEISTYRLAYHTS